MRLRRKQTLMDRASELAESVLPHIESAFETALETSKEQVREAQAKAAPLIAQGAQIASDKAHEVAAVASEKASTGASYAAEKASSGASYAADKAPVVAALAAEKASSGRDVALAKVNELRGVEPEPKGGKLKKLLLITGLLAVGGFVFSKLRGSQQDAWQSSAPAPAPSRPTPAPSTGTHAAAAPAHDVAGGTPGEAVADSVEEPHKATTPDDPATIIDVDDVPADDKK